MVVQSEAIQSGTSRRGFSSLPASTFKNLVSHSQVKPDRASDFETRWRTRETFLKDVPGFVRFALLRGDDSGKSCVSFSVCMNNLVWPVTPCCNVWALNAGSGDYISMSTWHTREDFDHWRSSSAVSLKACMSNMATKVCVAGQKQSPVLLW